ncbi:MAG: hypothetical protein ACI8XO_003278 [Verrucomicrobiales bacterium]
MPPKSGAGTPDIIKLKEQEKTAPLSSDSDEGRVTIPDGDRLILLGADGRAKQTLPLAKGFPVFRVDLAKREELRLPCVSGMDLALNRANDLPFSKNADKLLVGPDGESVLIRDRDIYGRRILQRIVLELSACSEISW